MGLHSVHLVGMGLGISGDNKSTSGVASHKEQFDPTSSSPKNVCLWLNIFSSPEHNIHKGSFYYHLVYGVCRQQFFQVSTPPKLLGQFEPNLCSRNVPLVVLFKNCLQNLIPSKTLVALATKWILRNSLKIFSSETASQNLE